LIFVKLRVDELHQVGADGLQGHEHDPHNVGLSEQDGYKAWKENLLWLLLKCKVHQVGNG